MKGLDRCARTPGFPRGCCLCFSLTPYYLALRLDSPGFPLWRFLFLFVFARARARTWNRNGIDPPPPRVPPRLLARPLFVRARAHGIRYYTATRRVPQRLLDVPPRDGIVRGDLPLFPAAAGKILFLCYLIFCDFAFNCVFVFWLCFCLCVCLL